MSFVFTWLVLAVFWIALSGFYDPIHLTFGAVSVTLVTFLSHKHMLRGAPLGRSLGRAVRILTYSPWLMWQILIANIEVIRCVMGIKPIEPQIVRVDCEAEDDFGISTLANSITLTPGTVTVDVEPGNRLVVHALTRDAAISVQSGEMAQRAKRVEGGA